jgi:hypothetical protein
MDWDTDCRRFRTATSGGRDWGDAVLGDTDSFDPSPWLGFPKVILFGSNHYARRLPVGTTLVWVKRNDYAFGTFLSDAELAWMKGGHGVYLFKDTSMYAVNKDRVHPTQKPVSLMKWCINRLNLKPGATILDPYMGSGTTGIAADELGFNFVGIECHEPYFETAKRRIDAALAECPLFAGLTG